MNKKEKLALIGLGHNPCQGCEAYYTQEGLFHGCAVEVAGYCGRIEKHDQALGTGLYQFAATRFVCNSPWRQWWHLFSEVLELGCALFLARFTGDIQHVAREAEDVSQSDETFKRIMAGRGADIELAREEVIASCLDRGYYEVS